MKQRVRLLIPLLILALLGYGGSRLYRSNAADSISIALGTVERDRVTLAATAAEIITSEPIAEGSSVTAGTLLVQLDTTLQQAAVHKVESDIAQIEATLLRLRNGVRVEELQAAKARVDSAATTLTQSELDLQRVSRLAAQQVAALAQLDNAKTARDGAAARLRDARAQLALLEAGSRAEDIQLAEAQLASAQALLAIERQKLQNLSITATVDGLLDSLPWHVGERVPLGAQVAVLLTGSAPYVRAYIPETSRAALQVGTELSVRVDGIAQPFTGELRWIASDPAFTPYYALNGSERSRLVYLAEFQLPPAAALLPVGLPAQVELP